MRPNEFHIRESYSKIILTCLILMNIKQVNSTKGNLSVISINETHLSTQISESHY